MELGTIRTINIDAEMQASYLDYAMSVIVSRALPDVRDGLKPVHRRILYAMYDLGVRPDLPYKKSARIVGEVLGKYHPHGDAAVYEAMVRMAQDFSLRYPLVDGQGNFGSIDGDNAAAMRYTEARLAKIAMEMLNDIEKDTVDWTENFDGTLKEPTVLPAALPNLLVNGSSGIAVGMSTNIPPHNLNEVCDALCYLIDHHDKREDVTVEDLMQFIPGPDFPTGGVVFRYGAPGEEGEREDLIAKAYASGRGHITVQARAHIEEMSRNRSRIVVTELPYAANKTTIIERIAELARDGRIEGLTDLRDESDRTGMRLCIEMTRTVEPREILAHLYKHTPLQQTFGISLLALVDGEPRLLSLKRMLLHFIEHRQDVIVRRAKHDLAKAKQRAHILEGLLKALDILDEVIALIRGSRTADIARQGLKGQLGFTEIQAQAILDMQLRRLAALERRKLQDEYRDLVALIAELETLLGSSKKVLALIRQNLVDLKATYGDARRTQITDQARGALTVTDVIPDEEAWITVGTDGAVGRAAGRLPAGIDAPQMVLGANTHCDLYLFSRRGQATRIGVHQLPDGGTAHHADLGGLGRGDQLAAAITARKPNGDPVEGYVVFATAGGSVKRINLADLAASTQGNPTVIKLDDSDELAWAGMSRGGGEIMLITAQGQVIRFAEDEVRAMGLPAGGIAGIKLQGDDRVIGGVALLAGQQSGDLALVASAGAGRRSPLADFPTKGRGTQGVTARLGARTGPIVSAFLVAPADKVLLALLSGATKTISGKNLALARRSNTGKAVTALKGGDAVERALVLPPGDSAPEPQKGAEGKAPARRTRASTPKAASTKAAAPKVAAPKATVTKAASTKTAAPKATVTKAASTKAAAPKVAARKDATPKTAAPKASVPKKPAATTKAAATRTAAPAGTALHDQDDVVTRRGKPAVLPRPGVMPDMPAGRAATRIAQTGQLSLMPAEDAPPKPSGSPEGPPARRTRAAASKAPAEKGAAARPSGAKAPGAKATDPAGKAATAPAKAPPARAKSTRVSQGSRDEETLPDPPAKPRSSSRAPNAPGAGIQTTWSPSPVRPPGDVSSTSQTSPAPKRKPTSPKGRTHT
jgi:DNA gyrase subunit A